MAGIEKVCEFSGCYPASKMYRYKRDHIQICPEFREEFRGAKHILHIHKPIEEFGCKSGFLEDVLPWGADTWDSPQEMSWFSYKDRGYYTDTFDTLEEWKDFMVNEEGYKLVLWHQYTLEVFDPLLQGEVKGLYNNWSYNISSVKRRLKRMLRCRELNISKNTDETQRQWLAKRECEANLSRTQHCEIIKTAEVVK